MEAMGSQPDAVDVTLAALQAGDPKAREAWVRAELPRMRSVARRLLRDHSAADDVVQEAFVNAFRGLAKFRGESSLSTWLHRIVVNAALGRLRKAGTTPTAAAEELGPEPAGASMSAGARPPRWGEVERIAARDETRALTRRMIDRLPEIHRTVLILRDIEELTTAEAAEALSVSPGVVKTRLHRARLALKSLLEQELGVQAAEELA
jgi:RNA polymerase sigma-70 factor (ECF subfamily)